MLSLSDCIQPDWPAPPRVRAFVTTRAGGVSAGPFASLNLGRHVGDMAEAVAENRRRFVSLLPKEPRWISLVHGDRVLRWGDEPANEPENTEADAAVTGLAGTPCVVTAADCLPVLLCDRAGTVVGAAHAGWRGLCGGILERSVEALRVPPGEVLAWLGPAIGPTAFEVGPEVREAFLRAGPEAESAFAHSATPGKYLADLYLLAKQRLARAGVHAVYGGGLCTVSDPARFFSYRRDRVSGRMAAAIWLQV